MDQCQPQWHLQDLDEVGDYVTISRRKKDGTQPITAQKMKFSVKDFFSKCDQICRKLGISSHLLKKYLMENFIFCAVNYFLNYVFNQGWFEFQLKYWRLCFGFCKIKVSDSVSRDLSCYQNCHIAIENSENKKFFNSATNLFL